MACVCGPGQACVHHASGGMLAIVAYIAIGFAWAAVKHRVLGIEPT